MIKLIVTLTHLLQLVIHSYFMIETAISFGQGIALSQAIWNQFKYLTNFSNWMMMSFLIPFVYYDLKNYNAIKIKDRYPTIINLLFQGMNPIIFLVMASYQMMLLIDPQLLLLDNFKPTEFQLILLVYLHAGNWLLMQVEYILYEHQIVCKKQLAKFFCFYAIVYLSIYGIYYWNYNKHVYGFQKNMNISSIVILNILQFLTLFTVDFLYKKVTHSKIFKIFILENLLRKKEKIK